MKNKAPLALLEQVIMLLVLAVAAAVCLHLFASAGLQAEQNRLQDRAMEQVQNTAEVIKSHTGDMEKAALLTGGSYEDGVLTVSDSRFTVTAEPILSALLTIERNLKIRNFLPYCVTRSCR